MKKQLIVASVICVSLGIFYFASRESEVRVGIRTLELPTVDTQRVTQVVYSGKERFSISKVGDDFVLEVLEDANQLRYPASKEAIKELFAAISGVKDGEFVTEQTAKHDELHVNADKGQRVTLMANGKPVWELIIGGYADEQGRYVRVPSQDAVFLAKARFWDITRSSMIDFRERQIVGLDETLVNMVRIEQASQPVVALRRGEQNTWSLDTKSGLKAGSVSPKRLSELVKIISDLRATAFVDAPAQLKVAQPLLDSSAERIVVSTKDKELVLVLAKDANEKKAYARVEGSAFVFEISDYLYARLHPRVEDFKL